MIITSDVASTDTGKPPLASESGHWYDKDGNPVYEVPRAKGEGKRPTTLGDARKLDLCPSVTNVLNVAAKPGLEIWKADQLLDSALTLPMLPGELADDYKKRVIEDAKAQSQKARDKGTELHAAIEQYIQGQPGSLIWENHLCNLDDAMMQHGINILKGKAEHSFASPLGYGGKIDWHNDEPIICDFKTKEKIDDKKPLVWPEHVQQLAAYGFGAFNTEASWPFDAFRALNVFVGTEDKQVRVIEHEWPDIVEAFACFRCLLEFWQRTKKFGPYAKKK